MRVCGQDADSVSGAQKEQKGVEQGCQAHFPSDVAVVVVTVTVMRFVRMEKNFGNGDRLQV